MIAANPQNVIYEKPGPGTSIECDWKIQKQLLLYVLYCCQLP